MDGCTCTQKSYWLHWGLLPGKCLGLQLWFISTLQVISSIDRCDEASIIIWAEKIIYLNVLSGHGQVATDQSLLYMFPRILWATICLGTTHHLFGRAEEWKLPHTQHTDFVKDFVRKTRQMRHLVTEGEINSQAVPKSTTATAPFMVFYHSSAIAQDFALSQTGKKILCGTTVIGSRFHGVQVVNHSFKLRNKLPLLVEAKIYIHPQCYYTRLAHMPLLFQHNPLNKMPNRNFQCFQNYLQTSTTEKAFKSAGRFKGKWHIYWKIT